MIQIAYYRMTGQTVPVYESCSTAIFKHGRTECLRPVSMLTKACCEAFDKNNPTGVSEIRELIRKCSDYHGKLTREASMG